MGGEDDDPHGGGLLPGAPERRRAYAQPTELIERHVDGWRTSRWALDPVRAD